MIHNTFGKTPNTYLLKKHPTKGNKIDFGVEKSAKFRGASTSIFTNYQIKWAPAGVKWLKFRDNIVPIFLRSCLLEILVEKSTVFWTCKIMFSPWYDVDYMGVFFGGYLVILRKVTFRPKTPPPKCYRTKGKVQK